VGSTTTLTAYAGGLQEITCSGSGSETSQLDSYSIAGHLLGDTNGTITTYDLTDVQGTILLSLTASAIQGEQAYDPYGNLRYSSGTIGTDKGYTGQFDDAVTGLDYDNARWYDPVSGQFLSPDSVQGNAQGMDPYAYVGDNPETYVDPTGQRIIGCQPDTDGCGPTGKPTGGGGDPIQTGKPKKSPPTCHGSHGMDASGCSSSQSKCSGGLTLSGNQCVYSSGECTGLTVQGCTNAEEKARNDAIAAEQFYQSWINFLSGLSSNLLLSIIGSLTGPLIAVNQLIAIAEIYERAFAVMAKKPLSFFQWWSPDPDTTGAGQAADNLVAKDILVLLGVATLSLALPIISNVVSAIGTNFTTGISKLILGAGIAGPAVLVTAAALIWIGYEMFDYEYSGYLGDITQAEPAV
jgi:RHS repeat-associated protein